MSETRKNPFYAFSIKQLKIIGFVVLCVYTFGQAIIYNGVVGGYLYTTDELNVLASESSTILNCLRAVSIIQMISGFCVPVFAFVLVEGFKNTSSFWKYFLRILILGVVSEIPYDLAMYHQAIYTDYQNPVFALAIALLLLKCMEWLKDNMPKWWGGVFAAVLTISCICWISVLNIDFGLGLIACSAVYYWFDDHLIIKHALSAVVSIFYYGGIFALYVLIGYQGQKGQIKNKWIYYILYPAQLLVFAGISYLI